MAKVATVARILLGLAFVIFGSNAFLQFMPAPELAGKAGQFIGLLVDSGYAHVVGFLQLVSGILFLTGRYVPLALTLLAPVLVNILLYHIFFDLPGIVVGLICTLLWFVVFWQRRDAFRPLWQAR